MVVIDSQMLRRIDKVVNLRTTEVAGLAGRHDVLHLELLELLVIQIIRCESDKGVIEL
jgi:hypothetical protein